MGIIVIQEGSAGDWAIGDNIMAGEWAEDDNWVRKVVWAGAAGSDAVGECIFEIFYGDIKVAEFWNTQTTTLWDWDHMVKISSRLTNRAGEAIKVVLRGSVSATDKLKVILGIKELRRARR